MSKIICFILVILSMTSHAKEITELHYTTLLPIISDLKPDQEEILRESVVKLLLEHKYFHYNSHEGFYDLFKKRKVDLKTALYSEDVIKTVADKLHVGSLIRIEVNEYLLGYEVFLEILSKENKTLYRRKKRLNKRSMTLLTSVINFWIQGFTKESQFDATIIEVQKGTILVDFPGKNEELFPNKQFVVLRQIVDPVVNEDEAEKDQFVEVARGVVTDINEEYFMGKILETKGEIEILNTDFVQFKIFDSEAADKNPDYKYRKHDLGNYRKAGKITLLGTLMKVEGGENTANFTGAFLGLDFFLPSRVLGMFEFARKVGQTSGPKNDDAKSSGNSLNDSSYKALLGYSISPKGFKYISYLDLLAGWSNDRNYLSGLAVVGVGDVSFEGPVVGFRMEHPFYSNLSALTGLEYSLNPQFNEEKKVLGEAESTTSYMYQLGIRYRYPQSGFCVEALYRRKEARAMIKDSDMELQVSTSQVMMGISHFF